MSRDEVRISGQNHSFDRRAFLLGAGATLAALPFLELMASSTTAAEASSNIDDPRGFDHRFADVNGIRLHYVEEGKGPLVIMMHGFPFLWYLWRHQIRPLGAAGYRVVAFDMRGYGQSGCPDAVGAYDISWLAGDIVGLMNALKEKSAVLVGQDWGSPIVYNAALMRPELFRGVVMMCAPPSARPPSRPSEVWTRVFKGLNFYQQYLARPEAEHEIMKDLRGFLLGVFYSTSASCSEKEKWRWVWPPSEKFSSTWTVPTKLPPFLSQQALDYYVEDFERTGIKPSLNYYTDIDRSWEITSFLDGAVAPQPALFVYGESDPSTQPQLGIDRQGPALHALKGNFPKLQGIIKMPGVGHTPPEEKPAESTTIILDFLNKL
jgi:pimeloyl-ACP methyl ester carboxylesterase